MWIKTSLIVVFGFQNALAASFFEQDHAKKSGLNQVLNAKSLGIDSLDAAKKEAYLKNAKTYSEFVKWVRKMPSHAAESKVQALIRQCEKEATSPEFCSYLKESYSLSQVRHTKRAFFSSKNASKIAQEIKNGNIDAVSYLSESHLIKALARLKSWNDLEVATKKVFESKECFSPQFLTVMGMKTEEFFPDEKMQETSLAYFKKAILCGGEGEKEIIEKAEYRASLLSLLKNDCDEAVKTLTPLTFDVDSPYHTRSVYWLGKCAEKREDKSEVSKRKSELGRTNPISFHFLSLQGGVVHAWTEFKKNFSDPALSFESLKSPNLNLRVRLTEALLLKKENDLARRLLFQVWQKAENAEPEFRLYLSALAYRMGESILHFQILDSIFRDDSSFISYSTLKLFFPLKHFPTIYQYKDSVDPYLVAGLIRQESGFNEKARSHVGALGLMQLMPSTAWQMARVGKGTLIQPKTNVKLGVKYFSQLLSRFQGDIELSLAAYNAGPLAVDGWVKRYPTENRMLFLDLIPYAETRKYVTLISRNYYWYLSLYSPSGAAGFASRELASLKSFSAKQPK